MARVDKVKRVMLVCPTFYPENSGYANAFLNFVRCLQNQCHDFDLTVITFRQLGGHPELSFGRSEIIRLKPLIKNDKIGYFLNRFLFARFVNRKLQETHFDLVFIETIQEAFFLAALKEKFFKKILVRIHATTETESFVFFNKYIYRINLLLIRHWVMPKLKFISSTNSYHIDFLKHHFLGNNVFEIASKKFFVIPNTILDQDVIKQEPNKVDGPLKFLLLGRLSTEGFLQKGIEDFVDACILLGKDYLRGKVDVVIVGEGAKRGLLEEKISSNGFDKIVRVIPSLSHGEVIRHLKEGDVVVLPSRFEGLSMFALEAIAMNNAVIFSRTGGLVDLVGGNGFTFAVQDIEDLASCIRRLVGLDPDQILVLKGNSGELFRREFSEPIVGKKFRIVFNIITQM
ncbi:MAG: glycosyltransferase family 4 protein [Cyclobacteriaceae bacterium]